MEEKKKRVRATLTQVRQLESELESARKELSAWKEKFGDQLDGTSRLVADCDGWREKYQALASECSIIREERDDLRVSLKSVSALLDKQAETVKKLRGRSLWSRIVNRDC